MSPTGDDGGEMPRPDHFDDDAIDALLAGTARAEDARGLPSFIDDLRTAAGAVPTPSPALAAAIAQGGISTTQPRVAQWRTLKMKLKGFIAGLGIAGKLALGVGVAAAATTGAGAAGVLPGPVQHAVSQAVGAVTPFSMPDPDHHGPHATNLATGDGTTTTTSTTVRDATTTSVPGAHDGNGDGPGDGGTGVVTPTTIAEHHGDGEGATTTTIAHDGNGNGDGNGDGNGNGTTPTTVNEGNGNGTTPTTVQHGNGDGDNNNPQAITLSCVRAAATTSVTCTWSASPNADHAQYVLLRTGDGYGRVETESPTALSFTDTSVVPGVTYSYLVDSLRSGNSVDAHSNRVTVECCGDATTTTTVEHHDVTTTTTVEHH